MNATIVYDNEKYFDLVESVRKSAKAHGGTFTADEMLQALEAKADPTAYNDNLNAQRISSALATLSSHIGQWEIKEIQPGVYQYEG